MGSLVDFNIAQSSSSDMSNIKWTKKNVSETRKQKSKKKAKISPSNIIYTETKVESSTEKVFIVADSDKPQNKVKKISKRVQKSSASNCNIKQGFKRPGR
jgi:phosphorylcholine metabolism protein LicD